MIFLIKLIPERFNINLVCSFVSGLTVSVTRCSRGVLSDNSTVIKRRRFIPLHSYTSSLHLLLRQRTTLVIRYSNNLNFSPKSHHLHVADCRCRKLCSLLRCSASSFSEKHHTNSPNSNDVIELQFFSLPLVLFPSAILPLQIFEFRYHIMTHTLLHIDLRFDVIYTDGVSDTAEIGCVGKVIKHKRLVDDRFFLICKGKERFHVTKVVRTKLYLVAKVTWLEDRPSLASEDLDLERIADEMETYMKDVIRLSNRLGGKPEKEVGDLGRNLFPTPFSFFAGSTLEGAPRGHQALLELEDTAARLKREKETLRNTLNYLTTASVVNSSCDCMLLLAPIVLNKLVF